jgi:hypothetical protein
MECKDRSNKLLAWSAKLTKLLAWSAKCSSSIQSYHIKALTPGMEFKSELFHPTKIRIELTSFQDWNQGIMPIKSYFPFQVQKYSPEISQPFLFKPSWGEVIINFWLIFMLKTLPTHSLYIIWTRYCCCVTIFQLQYGSSDYI